MPRTLTTPIACDLSVKKSLFRAQAAPIDGEEAARTFLHAVADPDATHNCWAWKSGQRYRSSDDGEPGGTAGRPILQAIETQGFDRVMIVVTRWFGGIKLGAGGLVRAYGSAAASCLRDAPSIELVPEVLLRLHVGFAALPLIQSRLESWRARQQSCAFDAEGAWLDLSAPEAEQTTITEALRDITHGQTTIQVIDPPA